MELRKIVRISLSTALPVLGDGFNIYYAPHLIEQYSWSPRTYMSWKLLQNLSGFPRVDDLFDVKTGSRSGNIRAFLIEKEFWRGLPKSEQSYFRPAVVNETLRAGYLHDSQFVFYPYGAYSINSESELSKKLPTFYQYFRKYKNELLSRLSKAHKKRWWEMSESRNWQHKVEPKLVSVSFGNAGSFGWDSTGRFVVVGGFAWLPKYSLVGSDGVFSSQIALAYLAILNSPIMSELLSATSKRVQGGQWDLSNKFVKNIAIPNLTIFSDSSLLVSLTSIGEQFHSGEEVNSKYLEDLVWQLYTNYAPKKVS